MSAPAFAGPAQESDGNANNGVVPPARQGLALIKSKVDPVAPAILLHGGPGIGKTTFGASAPSPVFVLTENGLGILTVSHFPLAKSFDDVLSALAALYSEPHDFQTLVVDSVDHLEPLIHARVCKEKGFSSIEDPGYAKGYTAALKSWREYLAGLNALRLERGITIIQIAHSAIRRFNSPEVEPFQSL